MAAPEGVEVEGDFKRITVTWVAPEGSEPDYVIVNVMNVREEKEGRESLLVYVCL